MDARFVAIAADAAKRYSESSKLSDSSKILLDDFMSPKITTVDQLIQQVERQNEQFSSFRSKRHALFGALAATMKPIEVIGGIVAGVAEEGFPPAQNVFSAVMYLIKAAQDTSAMYDCIIDLLEQLQDFTSRLNIYIQHKLSPPMQEKLTSIMATLFEVLVISTQEVRRGRFKAYFKRLFGMGSPVQPALERLQVLTTGEEKLVLAETYGSVSRLHDTTERVENLVTLVNENVRNLRLDHLGQIDLYQRDKLKAILEPSPFAEDFFSAFSKSRIAGTGDWICKDETLQSWIKGEKTYLWICGSPGTGKSFLTARLISWGIESLGNMAYFFFRENNPETRSVVQALRDIAYQLSETDASYAKALMNSLQSADEIKTVASAFRRLLVQPLQTLARDTPTYIFLDGIDEAYHEEIDQLLFQLAPGGDTNVEEPSSSNIRIALIGRSYMTDTITNALDPQADGDVFSTVQITTDRSARDVAAFIATGVAQSRILARTAPAFREEVMKTMERQVDGLFILAKFMLAELNRKRHPRSILQSLETFPKEIDGMLLRTLESLADTISQEEADDLNEMLRWIVCAEEALSLEQLEAVLILKFGDPPFRLEETLRGQYGCFFELEREDGLTTDDLIKDFERKQRSLRRDTSPMSKYSPDRRVSVSDTIVPGRALNPRAHEEARRRLSMSSGGSSSPHSPTRSIVMNNELEYRSKKSTTSVSFFHSTVREFFRNFSTNVADATFRPSIAFDNIESRLHIVRTCLRIFSDAAWFGNFKLGPGKAAMRQYAAWYWQEHVAALDPAVVSVKDKQELVPQIAAMLIDEPTFTSWTILYLKNNEGLEVLNDANLAGVVRWFADPDVVTSLSGAAKDFALSVAKQPAKISEVIGRHYAKAWLCADFEGYIPTVFCFDIVQSATLMATGYKSGTDSHWLEISLDNRIAKAAEWAGYPESGVWHRRIGSTYLTLGRHDDALAHYKKALAMDNNKILTLGRMAYCLTKDQRYGEALQMALECVALEESSAAEGKFNTDAMQRSKWRLYKDYYLIACCYYHTSQIEESLEYYRKAIGAAAGVKLNPSELFQSEIGYLETLYNENLHADMMQLVDEMSLQIAKKTKGESRLVEMMLGQANKRLVLDWIPKAASKTGKTEATLELLETAIATAHDLRDPVIVLYLRLAYGAVCAFSHLVNDAIAVFEQISLVEYRPRGTIIIRQAHAISFQRLAALYKRELLRAGIHSTEAAVWIEKLGEVRSQQDQHQNTDTPANVRGSDVNMATIYLGLYHRLVGNLAEAKATLKPLVLDSLDLLADSEPENDVYALDNLLWLMTADGDIDRARSLAQSMRRVNPNASVTTQSDSPVLQRMEPKLPNIQLSDRNCAQCLHNIPSSEDFSICLYCMECFCMACAHATAETSATTTTIVATTSTASKTTTTTAGTGNKTTETSTTSATETTSTTSPTRICRSDHESFIVPPLNRTLHTGEILDYRGDIQFFGDWEAALRKEWAVYK